jgi:hypothetical protein
MDKKEGFMVLLEPAPEGLGRFVHLDRFFESENPERAGCAILICRLINVLLAMLIEAFRIKGTK